MPRKEKIDAETRRENAMRPSRYLGYDHHRLGLYFIEKQALEPAEIEFRRAVWLNPYQNLFRYNLAKCLCMRKKFPEARQVLVELLQEWPDYGRAKKLLSELDKPD